MTTHRPLLLIVAMLIVGSMMIGSAAPATYAEPVDAEAKALQHVADIEGVALDTLIVVDVGQAHLPLTDVRLIELKVEASDGRIFSVSINSVTGDIVDAEAAIAREREQWGKTFGVVAPSLFERIQNSPGGGSERIAVAIWVAMPDPGEAGRKGDGDVSELRNKVRTAQAPAKKAARGVGVGVIFRQADLVPVMFAELTAGQIKGLAHNPHITASEEIPQNMASFNEDAGTSERFTYTWPVAKGTGAKIAVQEDDGIDNVNTYLVDPVYWCEDVNTGPGGTACTAGKNINTHATNVADVVASTHVFRRGGAWGIQPGSLLSANFQSYSNALNIVNSATWTLENGADTINISYGGCSDGEQNFYSRWVDYLVRAFGDSIVISAGNRQCPSGYDPDYVAYPGNAWNAITVGSYYDLDTGGRTDDQMSSFSAFRNPVDPNSGRTYEKPDVVGMGGQSDLYGCYGVETTSVDGGVWDSTCGTSFSAPEVTALTALVVGKNTALRNKAESVKAIVMAGATHNIVDGNNYLKCPTSPIANDCQDGAGAIDAWQTINQIVTPGNWRYHGGISPSSFEASGNIRYSVSARANVPLRAAIAWDSTAVCTNLGTASQDCASDVLNADLDLQLLSPSGVVVARSNSRQNSAEVIDYLPTSNGTYKIRVHRTRFNAGTTTNLGVAWNLDTRDTFTPLSNIGGFTLNTTKLNQTNNLGRSYWDAYIGPECGALFGYENSLEKVYRVKITTAGTLTARLFNQRLIGPDSWSEMDLILLKQGGAANTLNERAVQCSNWNDNYEEAITAPNLAPGTYYLVVDSYDGSIGKFDISLNFAPN